ncbi:MAG: sodium:proton antiporter, partial [Candidatus Binatia bacterium]
LTPLGDPPLFLGFLKGVDFFWPTIHLFKPTVMVASIVLATFVVIDTVLYRRDHAFRPPVDPTPDSPLRLDGKANFALLA